MTKRDQSGWLVVGVLFVTLFLIWGPVNALGVFFLPVIRSFGWSRAQFSALGGLAAIAAGISGPLIGWLIDRVGARVVMIAGTIGVVVYNLALSRASSLPEFAALFIVAGVAIAASTILPCSIVITAWFAARRGLAMGIAFAGIPLGGAGITLLANYIVQRHGWRAGYVAMALPVAAIVVPALVVYLRARPPAFEPLPGAVGPGATPAPAALPGLKVREALQARSLWLIAVAQLLLSTAWVGVGAHLIPYLIGVGWTPTLAAEVISIAFVFSAGGNFFFGALADRLNGRITLGLVCFAGAAGITALFYAAHGGALLLYLLFFGTVGGTRAVLIPLVIVDSLGVKHLGTLLGMVGIFATIGFAAGPIIAGRIYDVTGSYATAFWLFIVLSLLASAAIFGCRPLAEERSRVASAEPSAA